MSSTITSESETSYDQVNSDVEDCQAPALDIERLANDDTTSVDDELPLIKTYKIVGDNLDKNIRPRFMRIGKYHSQPLHLFHSFAVLDRIDMTNLSDACEHTCLPSMAESLLPSTEDDQILMNNFSVLISRILVKHMSFFENTFSDIVCSITYFT